MFFLYEYVNYYIFFYFLVLSLDFKELIMFIGILGKVVLIVEGEMFILYVINKYSGILVFLIV